MSRSSRKRRKARLKMQLHDPKWIAIRNLLAVYSIRLKRDVSRLYTVGNPKEGYCLYVGKPERLMGTINEDAPIEEWVATCAAISRGELAGTVFMYHGTSRHIGKSAALGMAYGLSNLPRFKGSAYASVMQHFKALSRQQLDTYNEIEARIEAASGIDLGALAGGSGETSSQPPAKPAPRQGWRGYRPATVSEERQRLPEARRARRALYRK